MCSFLLPTKNEEPLSELQQFEREVGRKGVVEGQKAGRHLMEIAKVTGSRIVADSPI